MTSPSISETRFNGQVTFNDLKLDEVMGEADAPVQASNKKVAMVAISGSTSIAGSFSWTGHMSFIIVCVRVG